MGERGICCAGNMIVDITYPIAAWPRQNELTQITDGIFRSSGGAVCNTITDLARLDPQLHLVACGCAGHDAEGDFILQELGKYPNIDLSTVRRDGRTSFTAVMSNNQTKERTFFYHAGGSGRFGETDIDWEHLDVDIFHIGYILLLPHLDEEDPQYGTKMARLLHRVQRMGIKTSVDVVSQTGGRYRETVAPALKYTDYCIINELEAQQTTGVVLREEDGTLRGENFPRALRALKEMGVSTWAVIHCPEFGCGIDETGHIALVSSLKLPQGYIQGTVGAGDAFCAGVLYAALKGWTLRAALELGACTAAASLGHANASDGVGLVGDVLALADRYAWDKGSPEETR